MSMMPSGAGPAGNGAICWPTTSRNSTASLPAIGVHRLLYQGPPKTSAPHYDITGLERDRALRMGAVACSRDEIVAVFRRVKIANGKVARPDRVRAQAKVVEACVTGR